MSVFYRNSAGETFARSSRIMNLIQLSKIFCPYCGQLSEITIDSSIDIQEYIEDCTVCCRPMILRAYIDEDGCSIVDVKSEND